MAVDVCVVPTGVANLRSVFVALQRVGGAPILMESAEQVASSPFVVLPGVGAFRPAMQELENAGVVELLRQRMLAGEPTLAVCLGMQLLCEGSAESPGVAGLGVVPLQAERLSGPGPIPQMGWNRVRPESDEGLLTAGHAYFANSYCLAGEVPGWNVARTEYGTSFVCAMQRGRVLACQFHPELSGAWGQDLLQRWLEGAGC